MTPKALERWVGMPGKQPSKGSKAGTAQVEGPRGWMFDEAWMMRRLTGCCTGHDNTGDNASSDQVEPHWLEKRRKMEMGEGHAYRWSRAMMPGLKMPSIEEETVENPRRATAHAEEGVDDTLAAQSSAAIDELRSATGRKQSVWTGNTLIGTDVD
jgi:hypothetical protein